MSSDKVSNVCHGTCGEQQHAAGKRRQAGMSCTPHTHTSTTPAPHTHKAGVALVSPDALAQLGMEQPHRIVLEARLERKHTPASDNELVPCDRRAHHPLTRELGCITDTLSSTRASRRLR